MNAIDNTPANVNEEILAEEAYHRVEPELLAIPAEKVVPVGFELTTGASTALGSIPRLVTLKDVLKEELRKFDVRNIDRLEDYAYAVLFAHSVYQSATRPSEDLQELLESGVKTRDLLHDDARVLAGRGLIPAESLEKYDGLVGYMNVAEDLQLLSTLLSTNWNKIEGRCATTRDELELASRRAGRIVRLVGERERNFAKAADSADKRARAFTLFFDCYEEIRFAVAYVRRHEDDADEFAPSLHTTRRKPAKTSSREDPADPAQPANPSQPTAPAQPATPVNRNLDQLPGGSPFMS